MILCWIGALDLSHGIPTSKQWQHSDALKWKFCVSMCMEAFLDASINNTWSRIALMWTSLTRDLFDYNSDAFLRPRGTRGPCEILSQNLLLGFVCMCKCSASLKCFLKRFQSAIMHRMRHEASMNHFSIDFGEKKLIEQSWISSKARWTKRCNVCAHDAS